MFQGRSSAAILLLASGCVIEEPSVSEDTQEIVGGTAIQITSAPWQVSMQSAGGSHFCGGSIVAPTWILTASHCVSDGPPGRIVAGISQLSQSAQGQIRTVKRVVMYPGYTDPTAGKDAALVELTSPLTLDGTTVKAIRPVLGTSPAALTATGVMTTVTGWGATAEGATTLPNQLQSVQLPIIALATANAAYNMTLTPDQLAAGVTAGGKDSCQGDSGGPLVVMDGAEPVLAGIVSWGEGCARPNIPGLYGRVSSFTQWADTVAGGPPIAAAGSDMNVAFGSRVTVDGSASQDAGGFGTIAAYEWKQVGGAAVTLENATTKQVSFTAPNAQGTVELELTVRDGGGASATDRVTIQFSKNGAPENTGGGNGTGDEGEESNDVVGGCSAHGNTSSALLLFVGLGLLLARRRRTK